MRIRKPQGKIVWVPIAIAIAKAVLDTAAKIKENLKSKFTLRKNSTRFRVEFFYALQKSLSKLRYCMASEIWAGLMFSESSKSAMVRATFRILS